MNPLVAPLFVPGDRPERFAKAVASGADMVVIDLEDAVAIDAKDTARTAAVNYLAAGGAAVVRVNAPTAAEFVDDLAALSRARPAAIMIPKFECGAQAAVVRDAFGHDIPLIALIETPAAFTELASLLHNAGILQAAVGTIDLAAELDCTLDSPMIEYARCHTVMASRIAGLPGPLDGITTNFANPGAAGADARQSRRIGFHGKLCIHPRQVGPVRAAFLPGPEEIEWARSVVAHVRDGVASLDGEMLDVPVIRRARRILDQAGCLSELQSREN